MHLILINGQHPIVFSYKNNTLRGPDKGRVRRAVIGGRYVKTFYCRNKIMFLICIVSQQQRGIQKGSKEKKTDKTCMT